MPIDFNAAQAKAAAKVVVTEKKVKKDKPVFTPTVPNPTGLVNFAKDLLANKSLATFKEAALAAGLMTEGGAYLSAWTPHLTGVLDQAQPGLSAVLVNQDVAYGSKDILEQHLATLRSNDYPVEFVEMIATNSKEYIVNREKAKRLKAAKAAVLKAMAANPVEETSAE